jgi:hypothetical protein
MSKKQQVPLKSSKITDIGKLTLFVVLLGLFIGSYDVVLAQRRGAPANMIELRSAISKSAGHDSELQQSLVRGVEQAEASVARGNRTQAARSLNSITTKFSACQSCGFHGSRRSPSWSLWTNPGGISV